MCECLEMGDYSHVMFSCCVSLFLLVNVLIVAALGTIGSRNGPRVTSLFTIFNIINFLSSFSWIIFGADYFEITPIF